MFFGEYERTVDAKGRLTMPAHLLAANEDADWSQVVILKADTSALLVYDLRTLQALLNQADRTMDDDDSRLFMHRSMADVHLSELDTMNRISIAAPLLKHAGITKQVVVVGMFNRLELWNPDAWQRYLASMEDVTVPSLPDLSRARIRQVS